MPKPAVAALVAVVVAGVAGCGSGGETASNEGRLPVVASFYPLQEAAEQIGRDRVDVTNLTPIGGEPHDLDPAPTAIQALERAKVVFYLGDGFQPAVEEAVSSLPASIAKVDLLTGVALEPAAGGIPGVRGDVDGGASEALEGGNDPHVWVDPVRFIEIAKQVQAALIKADPDDRADYEANGAKYIAQLEALNDRFEAGLRSCSSQVVVASHAAFAYLAERYGLTQAPKRLSETVPHEIGATTDALNPVEGLTSDELDAGTSYTSIMDDNLRRLVKGLGCTAG